VVSLGGDHQRVNASLAVQLCTEFEAERCAAGKGAAGAQQRLALLRAGRLPREYAQGLRTTTWLGRSTVGWVALSAAQEGHGSLARLWLSGLPMALMPARLRAG